MQPDALPPSFPLAPFSDNHGGSTGEPHTPHNHGHRGDRQATQSVIHGGGQNTRTQNNTTQGESNTWRTQHGRDQDQLSTFDPRQDDATQA